MVCNALWYVTNDHGTIREAATKANVKMIPELFHGFKDLDDYKAKKTKKRKLSANEMYSHGQV